MKIQELALFMSYMVYKAVKKGMPTGVPTVSSERIEAAYKESEGWIERINEGAEVSDMPIDTEPYLIQYVISELNQPLEDGTLLEDEQKGEVFFVLKTVISSLTRSSLGQET
jgi:adenylosuccinate synthase